MTPDEFRRAKEIFQAALERPLEDRGAYVASACSGEADLRREVESLLASAGEGSGFLDAARLPALPVAEAQGAAPLASPSDERRRIGAYTIVREIGRGGMGSVYLAERSDREYRGHVALKLVKRGMDTEFILGRFRAERQILASLNHPNIARLLDGGTTDDGLPYFVMEYIEGEHLTEHCQRRNLPLRERIGLFRTVCAAVQYAHQNLVVHRDIKPSNLLVAKDGTVKLLDFGLAKLLDPQKSGESLYQTVAGVGIFTPEYASPEQVRTEPVTTATDVYSLGVVLYELLSGVHPYRCPDAPPAEIIRAILETEPAPPSAAAARSGDTTRARALDGDLDTIVLQALRKEPQRRYATVERLSADLRRHLEGLPVSARPDTLVYRLGKFVRRHRLAVAASLLVALSLVGGLSAALWQARVARQHEELARRRFDDVRRLAGTLLFELNDEMEKVSGSTKARELLVRRGLEYLDRLAKDAGKDPGLDRELSAAYMRVGDIQGGVGVANVGDTAGALASYRRAAELRTALAGRPGASTEDLMALSESLQRLGELGQTNEERIGFSRQAVAVLERAAGAASASLPVRLELQSALNGLADTLAVAGRNEEALAVHRQRLALCEDIVREAPENFRARRAAAVGYCKIGQTLNNLGRWEEALASLKVARERLEALSKEHPDRERLKYEVTFAMVDTGTALAALKRTAEAVALLRGAVSIREQMAAEDPTDAERSLFLGEGYALLGEALVGAGRREEGVAYLRRALDIAEQRLKADPASERAREEAAMARKAWTEATGSTSGAR